MDFKSITFLLLCISTTGLGSSMKSDVVESRDGTEEDSTASTTQGIKGRGWLLLMSDDMFGSKKGSKENDNNGASATKAVSPDTRPQRDQTNGQGGSAQISGNLQYMGLSGGGSYGKNNKSDVHGERFPEDEEVRKGGYNQTHSALAALGAASSSTGKSLRTNGTIGVGSEGSGVPSNTQAQSGASLSVLGSWEGKMDENKNQSYQSFVQPSNDKDGFNATATGFQSEILTGMSGNKQQLNNSSPTQGKDVAKNYQKNKLKKYSVVINITDHDRSNANLSSGNDITFLQNNESSTVAKHGSKDAVQKWGKFQGKVSVSREKENLGISGSSVIEPSPSREETSSGGVGNVKLSGTEGRTRAPSEPTSLVSFTSSDVSSPWLLHQGKNGKYNSLVSGSHSSHVNKIDTHLNVSKGSTGLSNTVYGRPSAGLYAQGTKDDDASSRPAHHHHHHRRRHHSFGSLVKVSLQKTLSLLPGKAESKRSEKDSLFALQSGSALDQSAVIANTTITTSSATTETYTNNINNSAVTPTNASITSSTRSSLSIVKGSPEGGGASHSGDYALGMSALFSSKLLEGKHKSRANGTMEMFFSNGNKTGIADNMTPPESIVSSNNKSTDLDRKSANLTSGAGAGRVTSGDVGRITGSTQPYDSGGYAAVVAIVQKINLGTKLKLAR